MRTPLHDKVLARCIEDEETVKGGLIIPDTAEKPPQGEVMSIENGSVSSLEVRGGDRILFRKYSGNEITLQDEDYLVLREDEIVGIVTRPGKASSKK